LKNIKTNLVINPIYFINSSLQNYLKDFALF